ncbi:MDR family MFS transporter [Leptolyngbya sp. Cla-17]|uniref:MDR family MFS transporter n=1 Tax=Leptolyngbya sp. Cla-17 TaxID=2803751 RepID=UPI001FDA57A9|nr:MFS transporter [Leptolyngbya sp. Cla-17]
MTSWLPHLNYQIWILAIGRLLSQMGSGFTLFYAPIFFVNQVGLSATLVGLGLGSQSISGVIGRFLGGSLSDGKFGRKRTVLLSAVISAIAAFVMAFTANFPVFVLGNLLMGLGIGLFWPSAEALVADLAAPEDRNEAFALNRLCDSLGLGIGVVLGGLVISTTGAYRSLFIIDGLSFLLLFVVVLWAVRETFETTGEHSGLKGWKLALRDRTLLIYCVVNVLFTTYIVQISSTLPLYFTNFVSGTPDGKRFTPVVISALFTWHLIVAVIFQIPAARSLNRFRRTRGLMLSAGLWGLGFTVVWLTGISSTGSIAWAALALGILSMATVTYMPAASSIVVDMAPESLRGVYLAVNSQCWAIGYFIGPPIGGWALDQTPFIAHTFWLGLAATVGLSILILQLLERRMKLKDAFPSI